MAIALQLGGRPTSRQSFWALIITINVKKT